MTGKPKMCEGVLCRDEAEDGKVIFFRDGPILSSDGWWQPLSRVWTLPEWKAEYDLAPPRPGKSFLVEIELD